MNRRSLLGVALSALGGMAAGFRLKKTAPEIRPPGALPPEKFGSACIRCFRCAEVCPVRAIRFDAFLNPLASDLPRLDLADRACILCMKCTEACPTDALEQISPSLVEIQAKVRMGKPVLNRRSCIPWRGEGVCRLCYYACPYPDSAVALVGPQNAPVFDADKCVGCGLCEEACPEIAHAIRIVPFDQETGA